LIPEGVACIERSETRVPIAVGTRVSLYSISKRYPKGDRFIQKGTDLFKGMFEINLPPLNMK